jgi:periodic tryptophan protein 1
MISSLSWIPRGVAKTIPDQNEIMEDDFAAMKATASDGDAAAFEEMVAEGRVGGSEEDEEEDEEAAVAHAQAVAATLKDAAGGGSGVPGDSLARAMAELDMDHYDDDNGDEDIDPLARLMGSNDRELRAALAEGSDEDSSDAEALQLRDTDLLLLAAKNEEDISYLEVSERACTKLQLVFRAWRRLY